MIKPRKTAAFMLSLLLCASACIPAAPIVRAETAYEGWGDSEQSYVDEDGNEYESEEDLIASYPVSGDFSYSVMDDGNVCIMFWSGTDTAITVPDTIDGKKVTDIGEYAFGKDHDNCPIETISLPASIEYISAENPFIFCTKLQEITVDSGNKDYVSEDGVLYSKDKTALICYPSAKKGDSFTIDSKVKTIGTSAVAMTELKSIKFPSSLETIGRHSFNSNESLKSADLSKTALTDIGDFAFAGCTALSEVKLPDSLDTIGGGSFSNCKALEDIELPEGLLSVEQSAFVNTGLTHIIIPSSVQNIGYSAFGYEVDDEGNETPVDGFVVVGKSDSAASDYCTDSDEDFNYKNNFAFMTPENFAESQEIKDLEKFYEGDIEYAIVDGNAVITNCSSADPELIVPEKLGGCNVTSVYTTAFTNCSSAVIKLPETVTEIRKGAFYSCQYLTSIVLPQSVKTVGEAAFGDCPMLTKADLGGAEVLEASIFESCPALTSITLSGNCKNVNDSEPFISYNMLTEINVTEGGDGSFCSVDGVLYDKEMTTLLAYPASNPRTTFKIPDSVKEIANSAFAYNNYLEEIDLSNVEEIGVYCFENCKALRKVKMSKNLRILGADAFYECMKLKSLRFYDKIEKIGTYSFGFFYDDEINLLDEDAQDKEPTDALIEGFKVYADKDTIPYQYAKDYGIKVVPGTIEIGEHNVSKIFLIVMGVLLAALIVLIIAVAAAKKHKKKKEEQKLEKIKENVAEKIKAKKEKPETEKTEEEKDDEAE
ncbi:MAG: leucine-rich repeat domain-containing protein [Ruminococcus sp.]|nr:leucine-rich repeat domain-containing protein [Ruminococcus sp.]